MGFEIERKWLVTELPGDIGSFPHKEYVQGYLCTEPTVRVRREGDEYVLTYKGAGLLKREEYNLPLTKEAYESLLPKCEGRIIRKTRYQKSLPEGYTVEELPKPTRMIACDNGLSCKLNFQQQGSVIQSLFEFEMKHAIFPATQYKDLSAFYGFLTDLCNSQIVIKKP